MNQHPVATSLAKLDYGVNLTVLIRMLVRGWQLVMFCSLLGLLTAIAYLHNATYLYTTELLVTPALKSTGDAASSSLGRLSGLASLAGFGLPSDPGATQFRLYVESMQTRAVADDLAQNEAMMRRIFRSEWNPATGEWERPASFFIWLRNHAAPVLGIPPVEWVSPNGARLQQFLQRAVTVEEDIRKPYLVRIVFAYPDRRFGVEFLSALDRAADARLRQMALRRAQENIGYLSNKLQTTTISEHRQAITEALSEQEKFAMMANAEVPFAAEPFGGPAASLGPTSPQPRLVLSIGFLGGAVIGMVLVIALTRFAPRWGGKLWIS